MVVYPYFSHYSRCISHLIGVKSNCAFSLHQWLGMLDIFSCAYLPSLILHWWSVPFQLFIQFCNYAVWSLLVQSLSISISIYPGYKSSFRHNLQIFSQICGLIFNSLNNVFTEVPNTDKIENALSDTRYQISPVFYLVRLMVLIFSLAHDLF